VIRAAPLSRPSRWFWQGVALCTIVLSLLAAWSAGEALAGLGVNFLRSRWPLLFAGLAVAIGISAWLLVALQRGRPIRFVVWVEGLPGAGLAARLLALLTIPAAFGLYLFVRNSAFRHLIGLGGLLWVLWALSLLSGLALKAAFGGRLAEKVALPLLVQGIALKGLSYVTDVSSCPFSLGWSEASRYYYASLPFAERLYGQGVALSILHPTRYFLQAIPFLMPGTSIEVSRVWQVLLWLGVTAITAGLLAWRLRPRRRLLAGLLAMWFFLYLFQGAVYYHLQICIWIILIGVRPGRPWRSLIAVVLASIWAGMSRVNWFPVPAMLAAGLYFLETPCRSVGSWIKYLVQPVAWFVAGLVTAFAAQAFYVYWSGNANDAAAFASSFTSGLLWYRLWPNPTFAPGIILGAFIATLPVLAIIVQFALTKRRALHPVRWIGLTAMLLVLFGGGLVVSVKIGGGGDLHNMDAYLTLLGLLGAYLFFDRAAAEPGDAVPFQPHYGLAFFAVLVPLAFTVFSYRPPTIVACSGAQKDLATLRAFTRRTARKGGEVLFISQRQLLTFGYIKDVPLVPDYEKLMLTEMALSDNQAYLDKFYDDLRNHRFAMIVSPPHGSNRDTVEQFSDEDNQWVKKVDNFLSCAYRTRTVLETANVEILVPRGGNTTCP
jgi:hypothetical protein